MTGVDDPDMYYRQPGHALSPDVDARDGRFKVSYFKFHEPVLQFTFLNRRIRDFFLFHVKNVAFEIRNWMEPHRYDQRSS